MGCVPFAAFPDSNGLLCLPTLAIPEELRLDLGIESGNPRWMVVCDQRTRSWVIWCDDDRNALQSCIRRQYKQLFNRAVSHRETTD